jgi:hypothetical protein
VGNVDGMMHHILVLPRHEYIIVNLLLISVGTKEHISQTMRVSWNGIRVN